jgi:glucokinase
MLNRLVSQPRLGDFSLSPYTYATAIIRPCYPEFSTAMSEKQARTPSSEASPPFFLGVDVGGTNIKIGLLDNEGKVLGFESIATNEPAGPQQAVERSAATCRQLAERFGIDLQAVAGVGLGTPGTMCLKRGMLLEPPNLPRWFHFPIRQALEDATGRPVSFINDANAAAYGEFWVGSGVEVESLVLITLGTGVGGGVISEGHLINGTNSFGSEIGHMIVDCRPDARQCVWGGGRGHLEAYASASAVVAIARERLAAGAKSLLDLHTDDGESVTAKGIYHAALEGDEFALQLIDETAFYLGVGVANTVHLCDPGLVVFGGAMNFGGSDCAVGQRFLQGIVDEFERRTFPNVFAGTKLGFATLGGDAGFIGAAGIAHHHYHQPTASVG